MPRLSAILKYRIGYTIVMERVPSTLVYNYAVDYVHDGKNLTGINAKIHKQMLPTYLAKVTPDDVLVPLFTLEKVGEKTLTRYTPLKAPSLGKDNPLRKVAAGKVVGALGNVVTIAGAIASGVTLEKAIVMINDGKSNTSQNKS